MATYGYCRVSSARQVGEGESLEVQRRSITGYAMMQGLALDRVYVERGVSGSKPLHERPQGRELLDALQDGDVILTPQLDRMFRSALDALDVLNRLRERGISLHMLDLGGDVTGNGISKLVFTILSAVAEAERDRIRERVSQVKADQRERDRFLGGTIPFGFLVEPDGTLQAIPDQQDAIERMRQMKASGASLRAIATAMLDDGIRLSHETVRGILARDQAARAFIEKELRRARPRKAKPHK